MTTSGQEGHNAGYQVGKLSLVWYRTGVTIIGVIP